MTLGNIKNLIREEASLTTLNELIRTLPSKEEDILNEDVKNFNKIKKNK